MIIAQYRDKTHLFNRLTAWWTRGPYSHTEIVFSDGLSGSASFRDKGVRLKQIDYSKNPERWDFLTPPKNWLEVQRTHLVDPNLMIANVIESTEADEKERYARNYIAKRIGNPYDVGGLVGFVWQAISNNEHRDFCSEVVTGALGYPESWRYDPNLVTSVLIGQGWVLHSGTDCAYRDGIPVF